MEVEDGCVVKEQLKPPEGCRAFYTIQVKNTFGLSVGRGGTPNRSG